MREKSVVPTNLLSWPRCNGLLPDQRLILMWLWASPYLSSAGCGLVPLPAAAATLGLDVAALAGGIGTLQKAGLIEFDEETGEIAIVDWLRFHTFNSPVGKKCFAADLAKVQSERLKNMITEKSKTYFPTATATATATTSTTITEAAAAPLEPAASAASASLSCSCMSSCMSMPAGKAADKKARRVRQSGLVVWTADDEAEALRLEANTPADRLAAAVAAASAHGDPLPGRVGAALAGRSGAVLLPPATAGASDPERERKMLEFQARYPGARFVNQARSQPPPATALKPSRATQPPRRHPAPHYASSSAFARHVRVSRRFDALFPNRIRIPIGVGWR